MWALHVPLAATSFEAAVIGRVLSAAGTLGDLGVAAGAQFIDHLWTELAFDGTGRVHGPQPRRAIARAGTAIEIQVDHGNLLAA